jgi:hypothetical protein
MKPEIRAKKDKCTLVASVDHGKLRVLGASDDPIVVLEGQVLELRASAGHPRASGGRRQDSVGRNSKGARFSTPAPAEDSRLDDNRNPTENCAIAGAGGPGFLSPPSQRR